MASEEAREQHMEGVSLTCTQIMCAELYKAAKTHRMSYLCRSLSQKSPIFSGSFTKKDLRDKAF